MFSSGYYLFFVLFASISGLLFLTIKMRVHPFIALLFISLFVSLAIIPNQADKTSEFYFSNVAILISHGFGFVLSSVGIVIVLGAIIGNILEMSGAAVKMGETVLKIAGKIHPGLAMNILGFIVSIPVFCDSGYLILTPLRKAVAKKSPNVSPASIAIALSTGLYASHVLVPPTPGPAAAIIQFGLQNDLFFVIIISLIVAIPSSLSGWIYGIFIAKHINYPDHTVDTDTDYIVSDNTLPSTLESFMPILAPIVLMALGSIAKLQSTFLDIVWLKRILTFFGEPSIALLISFLFSLRLVKHHHKEALGMWISEGIRSAGSILAIAGASGAFAEVLKATNLTMYIQQYSHFFTSINLGLFVPFIVASIIKFSLGSSTIAIVTASSLFAPILGDLGFTTVVSKTLAMMAIGSGAMIASHANDSYFWIVVELSNLTVKDAYKARTFATVVQGITAIIVVFILSNLIN